MKISNHLVSFAIGVGVGLCLLLLPKYWREFQMSFSNLPPLRAGSSPSRKPADSRPAQPTAGAESTPHMRAPSQGNIPPVKSQLHKHLVPPAENAELVATGSRPGRADAVAPIVGIPPARSEGQTDAEPKVSPAREESDRPKSAALGEAQAVVNVSAAPPAKITLNPIGYVERAGGKPEAVIMQENEVQVVHIGELIANRYRVTKISPDAVEAVEEARVQSLMARTDSPLGYVEKADGKVEAVVAEGDAVRLVPQSAPPMLAQAKPPRSVPEDKTTANGPLANTGSPSTTKTQGDISMGEMAAATLPGQSSISGLASVIRQTSSQAPMTAVKVADIPAPAQIDFSGASESTVATLSSGVPPATAAPLGEWVPKSAGPVSKFPLTFTPIGFIEKAKGEFAAILFQNDEIYVVRQGDRFAGHYVTLNVSPGEVDAVEESPGESYPDPFAGPATYGDWLAAPPLGDPCPTLEETCASFSPDKFAALKKLENPSVDSEPPPPTKQRRRRQRVAPIKAPQEGGRPASSKSTPLRAPPTYVFQTLGHIETKDGEIQAIVADGPQVYLVKQGEMFADQYLATSVNPTTVIAVRAPPTQDIDKFVYVQTDSGAKSASKKLYGSLHLLPSGGEDPQSLQEMGVPVFSGLADLGVNLLDTSLAGFDLRTQF